MVNNYPALSLNRNTPVKMQFSLADYGNFEVINQLCTTCGGATPQALNDIGQPLLWWPSFETFSYRGF